MLGTILDPWGVMVSKTRSIYPPSLDSLSSGGNHINTEKNDSLHCDGSNECTLVEVWRK